MCSVPGYEQAAALSRWETSAGDTGPYKAETNRIALWEILLRLSFKLLAPHILRFPHILYGPVALTEKLSIPSVLEKNGLQTKLQKTWKTVLNRKGYYIKQLGHHILITFGTLRHYQKRDFPWRVTFLFVRYLQLVFYFQ
jgi:hypothetical protein